MISRRHLLAGGLTVSTVCLAAQATLASQPNPIFLNVAAISITFVHAGNRALWSLFDLRKAADSAIASFRKEIGSIDSSIIVAGTTSGEKVPSSIRSDRVLNALIPVNVDTTSSNGANVLLGSVGIVLHRDRYELHMEQAAQVLFLSSLSPNDVQSKIEDSITDILRSDVAEPIRDLVPLDK
jgi:hypothetical protein